VLIFGVFGLCGIPENILNALLKRNKLKDLEVVSDNGGTSHFGLGLLMKQKKIKKMYASFIGQNPIFEKSYLTGDMELELIPQGTLAEKLRCGGMGIPGFYTKTGVNTLVEEGGIPIKFGKDGDVEIYSMPKETRIIKNQKYLFEESIKGDYSFIKGWKGDTSGNIIFRKTARNFNLDAAGAGKVCIAEVEELVNPGELHPDHIHLPGIFVHKIFKGESYEKRIENLITKESREKSQNNEVKSLFKIIYTKESKIRNKIAKRAAKELKHGMYVNLGIGIPTIVADYLPEGMVIFFQSENGMLGVGPYPSLEQADPDLINPGKESVSEKRGCSYFKSSDSFGMIRGGHLNVTILGGIEVSQNGDLANWIIPGKMVKGMGGAMDLVAGGSKVVVTMRHVAKGKTKILEKCNLPLTGKGVVSKLITDMAVFEFNNGSGMKLTEIYEDVSLDQVKASTEAKFEIAHDLKTIKL